jgi:hypothetical protein
LYNRARGVKNEMLGEESGEWREGGRGGKGKASTVNYHHSMKFTESTVVLLPLIKKITTEKELP